MVDAFAVLTRLDHRPDEDRRNRVGRRVALVERQNEERVVRLRPLHIAIHLAAEPGIAGRNAAVVHVVTQIRGDVRDARQPLEIRHGERAERQIGARRDVSIVDPRVVLAGVSPAGASRVSGGGHGFAVTQERLAGREKPAREVRRGVGVGAAVVREALGCPLEKAQIIGFAGVSDPVAVREVGALGPERVDVRRAGVADHARVRVVFHDDDNCMCRPRNRSQGERAVRRRSRRRDSREEKSPDPKSLLANHRGARTHPTLGPVNAA